MVIGLIVLLVVLAVYVAYLHFMLRAAAKNLRNLAKAVAGPCDWVSVELNALADYMEHM